VNSAQASLRASGGMIAKRSLNDAVFMHERDL
jgi:hypothetical protein